MLCKLIYLDKQATVPGVDHNVDTVWMRVNYAPSVSGVERVRLVLVAPDGTIAVDFGEQDVTVSPGQTQPITVTAKYSGSYKVTANIVEVKTLAPGETHALVNDIAYVIYVQGNPGDRYRIYLNDALIVDDVLSDLDNDGVAAEALLLVGYPANSVIKNGSDTLNIVVIGIKPATYCYAFYLYYQEIPVSPLLKSSDAYIATNAILLAAVTAVNEYTIEELVLGI